MAETTVEGVTGLNRELTDLNFVPGQCGGELGALVAFVTLDDPHSPVVLPKYDELVTYLEDQVPLIVVDAKQGYFGLLEEQYRVFSVPTLIWYRTRSDDGRSYSEEFLFRIVGTVETKKLIAEADRVLEQLYLELETDD